jgi:hypothetical protein
MPLRRTGPFRRNRNRSAADGSDVPAPRTADSVFEIANSLAAILVRRHGFGLRMVGSSWPRIAPSDDVPRLDTPRRSRGVAWGTVSLIAESTNQRHPQSPHHGRADRGSRLPKLAPRDCPRGPSASRPRGAMRRQSLNPTWLGPLRVPLQECQPAPCGSTRSHGQHVRRIRDGPRWHAKVFGPGSQKPPRATS